jgi:SAM-dependent methyltransferase
MIRHQRHRELTLITAQFWVDSTRPLPAPPVAIVDGRLRPRGIDTRPCSRHLPDIGCPATTTAMGSMLAHRSTIRKATRPPWHVQQNQQKSRLANPLGIARNLAWAGWVAMAPACHTPQMVVRVYDRLLPAIVGFSHRHLGKQIGKYGYSFMTRRLGTEEVLFLNWGYEEDPPMALPLSESDEPDRMCIQLYHRTAAQVDLSGKDVLEVSCGHGGAASYVMRTMHPGSYTGLDLNPSGIAFCRRTHTLPGLKFVQGDAENLPFPDESFDALINVEAAHLYPDYNRFLAEVTRVLRPGGHFLYADLRGGDAAIAEWEAMLADSPLRLLSQEDIGAQVLRGLEQNSPRYQDLVNRHAPAPLRRLSRDLSVVKGTPLYEGVENGDVSYRLYCLAKD